MRRTSNFEYKNNEQESCDFNKNEIYVDDLKKCVACHLLPPHLQDKIYTFLFNHTPHFEVAPNGSVIRSDVCHQIRNRIITLRMLHRSDQQQDKLMQNKDPSSIQMKFESTFMQKSNDSNDLQQRLKTLQELQKKGAFMQKATPPQMRLRRLRVIDYIDQLPNETVSQILKTFFAGQFAKYDIFNTDNTFLGSPFAIYNGVANINFDVNKLLHYSMILSDLASEFGLLPEYKKELQHIYEHYPQSRLPRDQLVEFVVKAYAYIMLPVWMDMYYKSSTNPEFRRAMFLSQILKKCGKHQISYNDGADSFHVINPFDISNDLEIATIAFLSNADKELITDPRSKGQQCL